MSNIEDNGRAPSMRPSQVRRDDVGPSEDIRAGEAHPGNLRQTRSTKALRLEIDIEAADLDELAKREALSRLRAKGHNIEEAKFYSRAVVERYEDGAVAIRVEE